MWRNCPAMIRRSDVKLLVWAEGIERKGEREGKMAPDSVMKTQHLLYEQTKELQTIREEWFIVPFNKSICKNLQEG